MSEKISKENNMNTAASQQKAESLNKLRTLSWMFGALFILSVGYIVYAYFESKEVQGYLTQQKNEIEGELATLQNQYNGIVIENDTLNTKFREQQLRIKGLKDSVSQMEASVQLLRKYKKLVRQMQSEKRELFLLADSLDRMNQVLVVQRDLAEQKLQEQTIMTEKLADQNLKLAKEVEKGAVVDVYNLRSEGVKVSSSGRVSETTRARRTDRIRVCMTLGKNKLAKVGEKNLYIRIATPNDKLLGVAVPGEKSFSVEGEKLDYSAKTVVYYEQENLDVCIYAEGTEDELVPGVYLIAVYEDGFFIGETEMKLK